MPRLQARKTLRDTGTGDVVPGDGSDVGRAGQLHDDVEIVAQETGTFAANNGAGNFEWDLTARGMRGDVDGYMNEYNPAIPNYRIWYPLWKNVKVWRAVGNGMRPGA